MGFPNAYKAIGLQYKSSFASAVCFARPYDNKPSRARILAQPFGSCRAPANLGRVVAFFQFLASRLLTLVIASYAGDIFCCEHSAAFASGFWASKSLAELLASPTSDKKDQPPPRDIYLLGAAVSLGALPFRPLLALKGSRNYVNISNLPSRQNGYHRLQLANSEAS